MNKFIIGLMVAGLSRPCLGQTLFFSSEQAEPGSSIFVVGDALTASTRFVFTPYAKAGKLGSPVVVAPSQASGSVAIVTVPPSFDRGVYRLTATNGTSSGNSLTINRPRLQWSDVTTVMPRQSVRLVGRNFGSTPLVTLTNRATKKVYTPVLSYSSDVAVKLAVPANLPPGPYSVGLDSGLAGTASVSAVTLPLTVLPAAPDPLGLGVAWSASLNGTLGRAYDAKTDPRLPARLAGNGVADDAQSFAIDLLWLHQHGGGTLVLPKGVYRVDDGQAWGVIYDDTIVRGAGKGKTVLHIGYPYTASKAAPEYHHAFGLAGSGSGLADLTVQNLNANVAPSGIVFCTTQRCERIFLKRVEFRMGNSREIRLDLPNKAMIADCVFRSTAATLRISNASELQFLRNVDYHRTGRFAINFGERIVLEGNRIEFDNKYRNATTPETGGMELSFTQRVLLLNNDVGALGPQPTNRPAGDGEAILTQYAQPQELLYTGMVNGASKMNLVPADPFSTTAWQDGRFPVPSARMAVMIVAGKGLGQWRRALAWTARSVSIETPWQVTPDRTSRFAIAPLNNFQHTYVNNRIYGGFYGIQWEDGALDSTLVGNTLTNTGFIGLLAYTADARNGQWGVAGSNHSFTAAWGNAILRNKVVNTTGARRATISVCGFDTMNLNLGPLVLGTDVRGNVILGNLGAPLPSQYGKVDGLEVISLDPNWPIVNNDVLVQGTILQDNVVTGSSQPLLIFNLKTGFLSNAVRASTALRKN